MKMPTIGLRQYALDYLYNSGFVTALVKKSLYPSLIDEYLEDYVSEVWVAILEQKDSLWEKLYNSAIKKGKDYEYELRNYFSRVIFNTVKSTTSNAYRKLVRHNSTELQRSEMQWGIYSNTIPDPRTITQQIADMNDQETAG
jgi:hypothetical protein